MVNPTGKIKLKVKTEMTELLGSEQIVYFNIGKNKCCARLSTDFLVEDYIELSFDENNFLYFDKETGERLA